MNGLEIIKIIKLKFEQEFNGNKSEFARKAKCDQKTIRDVFDGNHYMSIIDTMLTKQKFSDFFQENISK
tara:strand:+ start:862 stop:1068 length:207 start_codon:yes stop_codon:yes gene_type:complete